VRVRAGEVPDGAEGGGDGWPVSATVTLRWRLAGTSTWTNCDYFGAWTVDEVRANFRRLVERSIGGTEFGRVHECRYVRNGVTIECWEETGR
jgi:hypothetical protein